MAIIRGKLKKGDITLREVFRLSMDAYGKEVDDKRSRMNIDIVGGRLVARNNFTYDKSTRAWEQTGRNIKFIFTIRTQPKSYKKTDTVKTHRYPLYLLIENVSKGLDSSFRWRVGSFKRPKFVKKGMKQKQRESVNNYNVKNGIQMQFFFDLMHILDLYGLLYGPNTTNHQLPKKANPKMTPFFDKHTLYVLVKFIQPLLSSGKLSKLLRF